MIGKWLSVLGALCLSGNANCASLTDEKLTKLVADTRAQYEIPALAVVVVNAEQVMLSAVQGNRSIDNNQPVKLGDFFHIGSGAKSILSVVAGYLVETGKLRWDSRFFDYFPELLVVADQRYRSITLEQLLGMRAGIPLFDSWQQIGLIGATAPAEKDPFIKHLLAMPPETQPDGDGFAFGYSNASPLLAASMLEKVSGQEWRSLVENVMAEQLNINIRYGWPDSNDGSHVEGHARSGQGIMGVWQQSPAVDPRVSGQVGDLFAIKPDMPYRLPEVVAPAGDFQVSVNDYARYAQFHLRGAMGLDGAISAETIQYIHNRYPEVSLGMLSNDDWGTKIIGMDGSAGTFVSHMMVIPEQNMAYVILANSGTEQALEGVSDLSAKLIKQQLGLWWLLWI